MTAPQRVDVARLSELLAKATPWPWVRANLANVTICQSTNGRVSAYGPYDDDLATAAVNALPALLQQLAEAERAKEGACGLLREVEAETELTSIAEGIHPLDDSLRNRIAAYLAANDSRGQMGGRGE